VKWNIRLNFPSCNRPTGTRFAEKMLSCLPATDNERAAAIGEIA
jgi:hypothetical protein